MTERIIGVVLGVALGVLAWGMLIRRAIRTWEAS